MTAALRAWGAGRLVALVCLAVLVIETTATDQLSIPPFTHSLNGWSFLPPVLAIVVVEPLLDRSPDLTEQAVRHPVALGLARLLLTHVAALAVAGYCLLSPEGPEVAAYVVLFLAVATLAVAVVGTWYWVPLLGLFFGWLQVAATDFPSQSFAVPGWEVAAADAAAAAAYLGSLLLRERARLGSGA